MATFVKKNLNLILGIAGVVVAAAIFRGFKSRLIDGLARFIPAVEGFSSTPYWDEKRYSWGYGTAAPGSTGTITRDQAFRDMLTYLLNDYSLLSTRITRSLTVSQWVALLSFSYNEGVGGAYNLVPLINSGDDGALATKWRKYIYSGGVVNDDLVERREKELSLWNS